MSRKREIEKFLKSVHSYSKRNNIKITDDTIYDTLCNYGFNEKELNLSTKNMFSYWEDRFKGNPNLNVFFSETQPHFLQFQNGRTVNSTYLKLYVSLEPSAIYEGVNQIFDFISSNNMKVSSKVADRIRSDGIVLRIESTDDAEKVINYINNNSYLKKNSRTVNPFLNRDGVVGIGYDDLLSYNTTFSYFIADYLNRTDKPSYEEFVNYLNARYINLFQNQSELNSFTQTPLFKDDLERIRNSYPMINNPELYVINNYRIVFEAMLNNTYQDSYKNMYGKLDESKNMFSNMTIVNKNVLFDEYIKYAYEKYNHDMSIVVKCLTEFSKSNVNAITRDNDFRQKFAYNINPNQVNIITNYDIEGYVNRVLNYQDTMDLNAVTQELNNKDFDMFIEGLRATFEKYGEVQIKKAIPNLLEGDFSNITNGDYNYRSYFTNQFNKEQLRSLGNQFVNRLLNGRVVNDFNEISEYVFDELQTNYGFTQQNKIR